MDIETWDRSDHLEHKRRLHIVGLLTGKHCHSPRKTCRHPPVGWWPSLDAADYLQLVGGRVPHLWPKATNGRKQEKWQLKSTMPARHPSKGGIEKRSKQRNKKVREARHLLLETLDTSIRRDSIHQSMDRGKRSDPIRGRPAVGPSCCILQPVAPRWGRRCRGIRC